MDKKIQKLLYRSFEEKLNEKEREQLEKAMRDSGELQRKGS
jgi:hypothetical protein